jgi:hypothetical protein
MYNNHYVYSARCTVKGYTVELFKNTVTYDGKYMLVVSVTTVCVVFYLCSVSSELCVIHTVRYHCGGWPEEVNMFLELIHGLFIT